MSTLRLAVKESQRRAAEYALVYWPEEDSVSIVNINAAKLDGESINEECRVHSGRNSFTGILLKLGSKVEMEAAEELYFESLLDVPGATLSQALQDTTQQHTTPHTTPQHTTVTLQDTTQQHTTPHTTPQHTTVTPQDTTPQHTTPHTTPQHSTPQDTTRRQKRRQPLGDKENSGNCIPPPKKSRQQKRSAPPQEPTGDILDLAPFDPQQRDEWRNEMARNARLTLAAVTRIEAALGQLDNRLKSVEKNVADLTKVQEGYTFTDTHTDFTELDQGTPSGEDHRTTLIVPQDDTDFTSNDMFIQEAAMNIVPVPISLVQRNVSLPSSAIELEKLQSIAVTLKKYANLRAESQVGIMAVKLSREAIFGDRVLAKCTPHGYHNMPALPQSELGLLKTTLFGHFARLWNAPEDFDKPWTKALESVAQCCKRLRKAAK